MWATTSRRLLVWLTVAAIVAGCGATSPSQTPTPTAPTDGPAAASQPPGTTATAGASATGGLPPEPPATPFSPAVTSTPPFGPILTAMPRRARCRSRRQCQPGTGLCTSPSAMAMRIRTSQSPLATGSWPWTLAVARSRAGPLSSSSSRSRSLAAAPCSCTARGAVRRGSTRSTHVGVEQKRGWPVALPGRSCGSPLSSNAELAYLVCTGSDGTAGVVGIRTHEVDSLHFPTDLGGVVLASKVGADGSLYVAVGSSSRLAVGDRVWWVSVDPSGHTRRGSTIELDRDAYGVELGPDGTAYLRRYVTTSRTCPEQTAVPADTITGSEIIAFDETGVRPGWPYGSPDVFSRPSFGQDGTIYLTAGRVGQSPGEPL